MDHDEQAIRALLQAREAAVAAGDAETVLSFFADEVVQFDLAPPLRLIGPQARDVQALRAWFDTWESGVTTQLSEITVVLREGLAAVWGLLHLSGTSRATGHTVAEWSRSTVVLEKQDGVWKIVHEHSSYPLRMDGSGLAAVDLFP
jgi:uncharacterized protein (TIGR02246 family)